MTLLNVIWLVVGLGAPAWADTADDVVARARAANQVPSSIQSVTMTIVSKSGVQRVRELELRSRRGDDRVSTFLAVNSPSDLAGTKMLMIDHDAKTDEQMIYLPAFKRTNRISGSSRKGAFVGSDFSYEDLDIREAAEGDHSLVEETDEAWVIDTVPADSAQYSKVRAHIAKADLVARKVEFFDNKGRALKVLEVLDTTSEGGVTLASRTRMSNLIRGTHTLIEVTAHQIDVGEAQLPDETFTQAYLERG